MHNQPESMVVDASPTKALFIDMLVKDIPLLRAIIDLVDNSVDGARRLQPHGDYRGLWIRVEISGEYFKIADNCGGMSVETARHYAFRFGRPVGAESTPGSVGQFGVGMKRAFFKLGSKFRVESTTSVSRFLIEEDVEEWKRKPQWQFEFKELQEQLDEEPLADKQGTIITVMSLHRNISETFKLENFRTLLAQDLESAHLFNINMGLAITFNGIPLQMRPLQLLSSEQLKPAYYEMIFDGEGPTQIKVRIYAGISESKPSDAGWYVFCNGRMLLEHDQTLITGWGEGDEYTIPKYHNQYARFRGYVFFDSDDATLLPWNTTKTGVDTDSPTYKAVRLEMIQLMQPVISFLNRVKDERSSREETDEAPSESAIRAAKLVKLAEITRPTKFVMPARPAPVPSAPRTGRIQYSKPMDEIDEVKSILGVHTLKEVGERTFEYFYMTECNQ